MRDVAARRPVRIALCCLALLTPVAAARAQSARAVRVVAAGRCPSASDVAEEVRRLLPLADVAVAIPTEGETASDAVVSEDDGGISVSVGGQSRRFTDPETLAGQRCGERARMVAVFVAVVLEPPRFTRPPPPAPPVVVAQPPIAAPTPPFTLDLELGPASQIAAATSVSNRPATAGGTARLLAGRGLLRPLLGVTVQTATTLRFDRADVRGLWIPVDVGLRLMGARGRWDGGGDLALAVVPVRLAGQGPDLAPAEAGWRVEAGIRLGVSLRYWMTARVGISLSPHVSFFPRPYTLEVRDVGAVGETPKLWLGLQLGMAIRLR